ncbi:MAG: hypothetical protein ACOCU8_02935 [Patescibacteria group bacterium]
MSGFNYLQKLGFRKDKLSYLPKPFRDWFWLVGLFFFCFLLILGGHFGLYLFLMDKTEKKTETRDWQFETSVEKIESASSLINDRLNRFEALLSGTEEKVVEEIEP